jgi:hypothetical protein
MAITLRSTKGLALTYSELDGNFTDLDTRVNTKLASSSVSAFGLTLIDDASAATARATLGLGTGAVANEYVLPTSTTSVLGGVKIDGTTITIDGSGVISGATAYTLPTTTTSVLGGVKIDGTTITINGSGVISSATAYTLPTATTSTLGGVRIDGTTITISSGIISSGQFLEIDGGSASTTYSTGDLEIDGGGA